MVHKQMITIEGETYGLFLSDNNSEKPIILYVHGGPGSPEYALFYTKLPNTYLSEFNVCYYDQRGCGLSFKTNGPVTLTSHINDVIKLANYLRSHYNQDKVILMGHSFGTYLCIEAMRLEPEIFSAYIGIAQLVNTHASEVSIYDKLLQLCESNEDEKGLRLLEMNRLEMESMSSNYMKNIKTPLIMRYKAGLMHRDLPRNFVMGRLLSSRDYTLKEKIWYLRGLKKSHEVLFDSVKDIDLSGAVLDINIPMLFVHGAHDGQVSLECAYEYFERLSHDSKKFIVFNDTAHFPNIEKPDQFSSCVSTFLTQFLRITDQTKPPSESFHTA